MADRYWVGGSADWNTTAGTKWATTSGGAGGAAVPVSTDAVFFDANSGAVTVAITDNMACGSLNFTGFTGTLAEGGGTIQTFGSLTVAAGMTWSMTGNITLNGVAGGTITSNGKTLSSIVNSSSAATWQLGDALTLSADINWAGGTFTTNNHNASATGYSFSGGTANLGSSTLTATGATPWSAGAGATINAGTSTIKCTYSSNKTFVGEGKTYATVWHAPGSATGYFLITGANTFGELKDDGTAAHAIYFPASTTTTITTWSISGAGSGTKISIYSSSPTTQYTLSKSSGTVTAQYLDIQDSVATGGATWLAQQSTNSGNNSGWVFGSGFIFGTVMG